MDRVSVKLSEIIVPFLEDIFIGSNKGNRTLNGNCFRTPGPRARKGIMSGFLKGGIRLLPVVLALPKSAGVSGVCSAHIDGLRRRGMMETYRPQLLVIFQTWTCGTCPL